MLLDTFVYLQLLLLLVLRTKTTTACPLQVVTHTGADSSSSSSDDEEGEAGAADAARRKRAQHGKLKRRMQQAKAGHQEGTAKFELLQLEAARAVLPRVVAAAGEGRVGL